jgi:hypothetical protein
MQHNITSSGLWDDSRFGIGVAFAIKIEEFKILEIDSFFNLC